MHLLNRNLIVFLMISIFSLNIFAKTVVCEYEELTAEESIRTRLTIAPEANTNSYSFKIAKVYFDGKEKVLFSGSNMSCAFSKSPKHPFLVSCQEPVNSKTHWAINLQTLSVNSLKLNFENPEESELVSKDASGNYISVIFYNFRHLNGGNVFAHQYPDKLNQYGEFCKIIE